MAKIVFLNSKPYSFISMHIWIYNNNRNGGGRRRSNKHNNSQHLLNAYYMSGTVLNVARYSICLTFTKKNPSTLGR